MKEAQKEELDRQNRAQTNQALAAAGGRARWQNFGKPKGKPAGAAASADVVVLSMCMCAHSCTVSIVAVLLKAMCNIMSVSKAQPARWLHNIHSAPACQERCSKTSLCLH